MASLALLRPTSLLARCNRSVSLIRRRVTPRALPLAVRSNQRKNVSEGRFSCTRFTPEEFRAHRSDGHLITSYLQMEAIHALSPFHHTLLFPSGRGLGANFYLSIREPASEAAGSV
jgi:hypothetical protein